VNDADVSSEYIFQYLSQESVRRYYSSITTGQAYPQISLKQVRDTRVPLPPPTEQEAIASALSNSGALIESLDQLIGKKRDMKTAMMQQFLTGKGRLPGFSGEWEVKTLGELTECLDNVRVPLNETEREKRRGDIPWLESAGSTITHMCSRQEGG
jgi:type I restriction enzyme S subunit